VSTILLAAGVMLALLLWRPAAPAMAAGQQFVARTEVVEVYATVTDEDGRLLTHLTMDDFEVLEDGVPQRLTSFTAGDVPVSLALAFDRSWSMAGEPLAAAQVATRVLLNELTEADRVALFAISSQVDVVVPLTNNRFEVDQAVHGLDPWGSTALHDAVVKALDAIEPAPGRRALVLVSDGAERFSTRSLEEVYARVRQSDVMIYPVALARRSPPLFEQLAALSGGRATATRRPATELPRILRRFATELRHQYLLGYTPSTRGQPGYKAIEVRVREPGAVVRSRAGYTVSE
jgi:Ca-activated chloride channel homolog